MAAQPRSSTPSRNSPYITTVAPDTPTSLASASLHPNTLAPIAAAASTLNHPTTSPRSQKALSPRFYTRQLTGQAALDDQKRLRDQQQRAESPRTSPNPSVAAISNLLGLSPARTRPTQSSEQIAQMAQKIHIPENGYHENSQTSPVSMSSLASLETTTAAAASTTAPIMAPTLPPVQADNVYGHADQSGARPAVDTGVPGDSRAFTFPPPIDDPRSMLRNMSLPNAGMSSPRSASTKRHKCPYCSTEFTRHHNLKSHLLTHSQEKPYECQQCQSRFRRLHDLKRHTKLHTGERPHECPKCGRKFARGDALARHNKGQGGCAGRRSSFGMDPDDPDNPDGSEMAGIEYTAEPDEMQDDEPNDRRVSEPTRPRQDSGAYRAGPSTYPPPAIGSGIRGGPVAPMYPPSGTSTRDNSSPHPHAPSLGPLPPFAPSGPAVFHGGVTESPKPISPGVPGHRGSASAPSGPPSYAFSNRGSGPQLPPLPQNLPNVHGSMPPPHGSSQPGSMSSHSGSGASGRELLGPREHDYLGQYRDMESRMLKVQEDNLAMVARIQSDHARLENDLRAQIARLNEENQAGKAENARLREELAAVKAGVH